MSWLALSLCVTAAFADTPVPAGAVAVSVGTTGGIRVAGGAAMACPPDWCGSAFPALEANLADAHAAAPAAPLSMVVAPGAPFDAVSSVIQAARGLGFAEILWSAEGEPSAWTLPPVPLALVHAVGTHDGPLADAPPPPPPLIVYLGAGGTAASRYVLNEQRQPNRPDGGVDLEWLGAAAAADRKAFPSELGVYVDVELPASAESVRAALRVLEHQGYARMDAFSRRAPAPAAPGLSVSENPIILGALDAEEIGRVIKPSLAEVDRCYTAALKSRPALAGVVVVKFVINAGGTVDSTTIKSTTLGDAEVEACLARAVRPLKFPKPKGGGIVIVSWPIKFSSTEPAEGPPPR